MRSLSAAVSVLLFAAVFAAAQRSADDPTTLLEQAERGLDQSPGAPGRILIPEAINLLRRANAIWERSASSDARYAESLDLLAILLRGAEKNREDWQNEAAPIVSRALEIRQAQFGGPPADLALALELKADSLGRGNGAGSAGAPFWDRATAIRAELVKEIELGRSLPVVSAPAAQAGSQLLEPRGGDMTPPSVTRKVDPAYSETARHAKIACSVMLRVVVNTQGTAQDLKLVRGCGYGLDENAAEAVLRWAFQPGRKDGKPVLMYATIAVNFRLL